MARWGSQPQIPLEQGWHTNYCYPDRYPSPLLRPEDRHDRDRLQQEVITGRAGGKHGELAARTVRGCAHCVPQRRLCNSRKISRWCRSRNSRGQVTFEEKFKAKVIQQIHGREVGFLLGAGASYLSGAGYPLANALWNEVRDLLHPEDRQLIEGQIIQGGVGLEEALDILDNGSVPRQQLRHRVASAIANRFRTSRPPLEFHCSFIRGITRRPDRRVRVFRLNYDPLVGNAADCESLLLSDGFCGANNPFFHPV